IIIRLTDEAQRLSLAANPRAVEVLELLADSSAKGNVPSHEAVRKNLHLLHPRSPVYFVTSGALDPFLPEALRVMVGLRAWPIVISPSLPALDPEADGFARTRAHTLRAARATGASVHEWKEGQPLGVALRAA